MIRRYSDLILLDTFEERFNYLSLHGSVGVDTFGFDRFLNQRFYKSIEWKNIRNFVIVRDNGCDLGLDDYPISGKMLVHHMNPIMATDISSNIQEILNPEYLILVSLGTHNAIHYGNSSILSKTNISERSSGDTILWRKNV